jgi:hypothetical protein
VAVADLAVADLAVADLAVADHRLQLRLHLPVQQARQLQSAIQLHRFIMVIQIFK